MTKKVSKKGTTVATASTFGREDIPSMIRTINEKIAKLSPTVKTEDAEALQKIMIAGFPQIKDIKNVEDIIKAYSAVSEKDRAYSEACSSLKVSADTYPLLFGEATAEDIQGALSMRLHRIKNKVELDKLTQAKKLLEDNLSANDKLSRDLAKIAAL